MNIIPTNRFTPAFKGYDNVTAGRVATPDGETGCYVVTARLNNNGVNDLDRFSKILSKTDTDNFLTIHYEKAAEGMNPFNPASFSFINVNDFPLILDKKDMLGADMKTVKEVEKTSLPLAQNITDLLKRIAADSDISKTNSNTNLMNKSLTKTAESMCGIYKDFPGAVDKVKNVIVSDMFNNGANMYKETALKIFDSINSKMLNYFK